MPEIKILERSIDCDDAKELISELNQVLVVITGDDGTVNFSTEDVEAEGGVFLIGYLDGRPCGCAALRRLSEDTAEVKRVFSRKNNVGMGRHVMETIEEKAIQLGYSHLILETRVQNTHAIAFYSSLGYEHCEAFGKYVGKPNSYCFEKRV